MSMPGNGGPEAVLYGSGRRSRLPARLSLTTSRNPSSMSDVSVRFSATALRLARLSRSFGSLTVVRSTICQDISSICQYVNRQTGRRRRVRTKENRALAGPVQFAGVGAPAIHLPEGNSCLQFD